MVRIQLDAFSRLPGNGFHGYQLERKDQERLMR
jgi:hypothetical protein